MAHLLVALGLASLLCAATVHSQLQVTASWSGTPITGPVLIYHDEVIVDSGPSYSLGDLDRVGALVCTSETRVRASWRNTDGSFFEDVNNDGETSTSGHQLIRSGSSTVPSVARLSRANSGINPAAANQNGLWVCRVHVVQSDGAEGLQDVLNNFVFAGVYRRGFGAVASIAVTLAGSPSFTGDSPTFTLFGDTSGGPPETYTWTRNGEEVTDGGSFSISIAVNTVLADTGNGDAFRNTRYRSTLTVTGTFPGVYLYSVSNRAMSSPMTDSFNIQGGSITDLVIEQISLDSHVAPAIEADFSITWTLPVAPPNTNYRVFVLDAEISASTNSRVIEIRQIGVIPIGVLPTASPHYPYLRVDGSQTCRGVFSPIRDVSVLNATSANISFVPQPNTLPLERSTLVVERLSGTGGLCSSVADRRDTEPSLTATSMLFTDLQEFSNYRFTHTNFYITFGETTPFNVRSRLGAMDFTTPSAAPTGAPSSIVMDNVQSRTIAVSWNEIVCIDRNGVITGYAVEYQEQGGASISREATVQSFTATGLTPGVTYIFRVAGINSDGTGPFSTDVMYTTDEESPGPVSDFMVQPPKFTSVLFTWGVPNEPNGVITRYEVTYRINGGSLMTNDSMGLATNFTIFSLTPNTIITNISVAAYTSIGRGMVELWPDVQIPAEPRPPVVTNVRLEGVTDTSVQVSWDEVVAFPELTGYRVYYSQTGNRKRQSEDMAVTVPSNQTFALITGLVRFVEYQFQVVAVAELQGMEFLGNRSDVGTDTRFGLTTPTVAAPSGGGGGGGSPVGAIIGGLVLAVALVLGIVFLVLFILWFRRRRKQRGSHKPTMAETVRYAKTNAPLVGLDQQPIEPSIDEFPDDTHAVEGESVIFKVVVSGKPLPTLTWYHDDTEVVTTYAQEVLDDGSLNLPSLEVKQGGVYRLVAANTVATVEQQVKLTVQFEGEKTPDVDRKSVTFTSVPVAEFGEYVVLNHSNNNQGFRDQFQALETGEEYSKSIGLSPEFKKLNRFANITNYDHNHIILAPVQGHSDCEREFINGCYMDGYSTQNKFISTQGPIPRSMVDFWRLVWQERPPTIVMVTNLKEGNKKKCVQYWPDSGSSAFGPFKVTLTEHQVFADYCIRTMQVTVQGNNKPLKLQQYHFTAWPDHGVPDYATPMLAFHRRISSTHNPRRGPMLVHCSAGVGRTGTFICIDSVLEQIKKEKVVDIAGAINKMRHQRMKMVQTPEQYIFLHDAMLESVTCGDTQIAAADLRLKIKKYDKVDPTTGVTTFQSQFNVLEQVSPKISEVICKSATDNADRNRRTDYLPSDRFRVLLKGEHPDYIHAVFAHGYKHQKAYIMAEGPMASTVRNVLKILYDRNVGAVVMLSGFTENGEESSVQYWPPLGKLVKFGEYTVDLISEEALEGFTIRTLSILEHKTGKAHQVTQFHITCWSPDGRCSNLRSVVDCIEEIAKIQRRTGNKPIFVHCSDTVTRSGMFCAMATVIDRCKTEGVVDVFQVVKALRVQKPGAVPTVDNYRTVFESILTFLDSFDTYANFQNV